MLFRLPQILPTVGVVFAAIACSSLAAPSSQPEPAGGTPGLTLWYDRPAEKWVEALPLGNGRMAAMVFGGLAREKLSLNEDTLTSGEPPSDLRSLDITKDFDHVT
jgi:alpha-L-fucosidase 2